MISDASTAYLKHFIQCKIGVKNIDYNVQKMRFRITQLAVLQCAPKKFTSPLHLAIASQYNKKN